MLSLSSQNNRKTLEPTHNHREIIEGCKNGDRQSQFELYRLYSKAMYNICLRMLGNEMDAEDILQNSFIDVFTKLDSFRYESTIGAWIKRIVVNNSINFLKKRRLAFEELDEKFAQKPEDKVPVDDSVFNIDAVHRAIHQLPDGYRVVFSLYLLEGYDHEEIAQILNISEQTSKSQFSRAKAKLREILDDKKGLRVLTN